MKKVIATILLILAIALPVILGLYWLFWQLWLWVVPQFFPNASEAIKHPIYWMFVGMVFLVCFISRLLFGSRKD